MRASLTAADGCGHGQLAVKDMHSLPLNWFQHQWYLATCHVSMSVILIGSNNQSCLSTLADLFSRCTAVNIDRIDHPISRATAETGVNEWT